jgi:P27 family predicted phage terminase small subunit
VKGRRPSLETLKRRLAGGYSGPPPECPDWLDPDAKAEWERIAPALVAAKLLTPVDCMTLATYCQMYSQWKKAEQAVRLEGLTFIDAKGSIKLHPCARHAAQLMAELRRVAGEFGFSPASRSRVDTPVQQDREQSEFESFVADERE